MAFVNEYISDEDIEKYEIRELWDQYHPYGKDKENLLKKHSWTVDKERNIYFMPVGTGRYEESNQYLCVLYWNGVLITIKIAIAGGKINYVDRIGSCIWNLLSISSPKNCIFSEEEIISTLKEALVAYQDSGILTPMKEYQVTFNF